MRTLAVNEVHAVSAGLSDSEANQIIGQTIGEAFHGVASVEGLIGGIFGPVGLIAGAMAHYKLRH